MLLAVGACGMVGGTTGNILAIVVLLLSAIVPVVYSALVARRS